MKYLSKSFTSPANSRAYVDGWEATFGEKCECHSAYDCAWTGCTEHRCMECNEPCTTESTKTAVRWCPEHRELGLLGWDYCPTCGTDIYGYHACLEERVDI